MDRLHHVPGGRCLTICTSSQAVNPDFVTAKGPLISVVVFAKISGPNLHFSLAPFGRSQNTA